MMMRIAMYLRLSNEDEDKEELQESNSIESQRILIQSHISDVFVGTKAEIVEYVDDGFTGTNFNRPGFQKLIEDAKQNLFQAVVVKDFSRFGRDYIEVGRYLEYIFPILQIRFISVNDGYDSADKFGTTGGMSVALKNLVYGMYSADLSKKVRSARDTRVRNGQYVGQFAPYGYRKDPEDKHKILVDEEVSWVVIKIFEMAASGTSCTAISRYLNEEGIPSRLMYHKVKGSNYPDKWQHVKVKLWNDSAIRGIIKNEFYLGKLLWNRTRNGIDTGHKIQKQDRENWIIVDNHHEALVSEELFNRANDAIFIRKIGARKAPKKNYIFVCGHCGRILARKRKDYYHCRTSEYENDSICKSSKVDVDVLENLVLEQVNLMAKTLISNLNAKASSEQEQKELELEIASCKSEINQWKNKKMNLYEQYKDERISRENYVACIEAGKQRLEELERRIPELEEQIRKLQQSMKQSDLEQDLEELAVMTEFDGKKISALIDKVRVFNAEQIEIEWKINDPFQNE